MIISLQSAKKLYKVAKKHGVELPESKWVWYKHPLRKWVKRFGNIITNERIGDRYIPAYTTDELLEWLPPFISVWKHNDGYSCGDEFGKYHGAVATAKTPADALCLLAIKLIEEGVIK